MKTLKPVLPFLLGSIVFVLVIGVIYWIVVDSFLQSCLPNMGLFGDSFGALNAIFTGLAFAGVIYTMILQKDEIQKQEESNRQERLDASNDRFTNSFFNILSIQSRQLENLGYYKRYSKFYGQFSILSLVTVVDSFAQNFPITLETKAIYESKK